MKECMVCGKEFEPSRADARFCSDKCRKKFSRNKEIASVDPTTGEVLVEAPVKETPFRFKRVSNRTKSGFIEDDKGKVIIKTANYWYDVPLNAVPIRGKEEPPMPDFMNGRQYFLWRKNKFKVQGDTPVILGIEPAMDGAQYIKAGEGSRHWGT